MLFLRVAYAEIGDERPFGRHLQDLSDIGRIENRNPTDAQPISASREPEGIHCGNSRIVKSLGDCSTTEAMPGRRSLIDEHSQMERRLGKAGELELRIERGASAGVILESLTITPSKGLGYPRPARQIVDGDKAPGLTIADGGCETGDIEDFLDRRGIDWVGPKPSDIAPPRKEFP